MFQFDRNLVDELKPPSRFSSGLPYVFKGQRTETHFLQGHHWLRGGASG